MSSSTVLVVEDEAILCKALGDWLQADGYEVRTAGTGHDALHEFSADGIDAVVLDYGLPDVDGFEVLRRLSGLAPDVPVIMMTGQASVHHAVEAMKRGAFDYVPKPAEFEAVSAAVRSAATVRNARRVQRPVVHPSDPTQALLGASPAMDSVRKLIRKLGRSADATVLITGESGTGKDLAARALHACSSRADKPFTNITCTALPTALLESELFGHERGAFTDAKSRHRGLIERAQGGTVFLDEIGDMDPAVQAKMLRFLEEKRYRRVGGTQDIEADVRVVAATNVDLRAAVADNRFRPDLFYRLAVLIVHMPPLRERPEDIEPLARSFAGEQHPVSDRAMRRLVAHDWPGNVRELRNVMERASILAEGDAIEVEDLHLSSDEAEPGSDFVLPAGGVDMRAVERELLIQALERTHGNVTQAARLLGMNRDQVRYRVQKFGLRDRLADE